MRDPEPRPEPGEPEPDGGNGDVHEPELYEKCLDNGASGAHHRTRSAFLLEGRCVMSRTVPVCLFASTDGAGTARTLGLAGTPARG